MIHVRIIRKGIIHKYILWLCVNNVWMHQWIIGRMIGSCSDTEVSKCDCLICVSIDAHFLNTPNPRPYPTQNIWHMLGAGVFHVATKCGSSNRLSFHWVSSVCAWAWACVPLVRVYIYNQYELTCCSSYDIGHVVGRWVQCQGNVRGGWGWPFHTLHLHGCCCQPMRMVSPSFKGGCDMHGRDTTGITNLISSRAGVSPTIHQPSLSDGGWEE